MIMGEVGWSNRTTFWTSMETLALPETFNEMARCFVGCLAASKQVASHVSAARLAGQPAGTFLANIVISIANMSLALPALPFALPALLCQQRLEHCQ